MRHYHPARLLAALGAAMGLLVAASQVDAHAALVSTTPAANSTVTAPRQVTLRFNEKLAAKFSGIDLMKVGGGGVTVDSSVPAGDGKTVVGVISGPLAPGTYMVMWHAAAADDGHRTKGDFTFTVR